VVELPIEIRVNARRSDEAEPGVQFVDLAVGIDARRASSRAAEQRRLPASPVRV
jgi:hypothetical protein